MHVAPAVAVPAAVVYATVEMPVLPERVTVNVNVVLPGGVPSTAVKSLIDSVCGAALIVMFVPAFWAAGSELVATVKLSRE